MARTLNKEEHAEKRNEILDAAQHLISTKGYERMTIQDIRDELGMSNGAFFHYFVSKAEVLKAFIERIREMTEKPLLPIIQDPHLSALEKLRGFFATLDNLRHAQKTSVIELLRVWYTDDNAIVRLKVDEAVLDQRAPLLTKIVHQGIREGVFATDYPEQAGEIILSILQGMRNTHAKFFLSLEQDVEPSVEAIVSTYAAYMDSIEHVLGAPSGSLSRLEADAVKVWVSAMRDDAQA